MHLVDCLRLSFPCFYAIFLHDKINVVDLLWFWAGLPSAALGPSVLDKRVGTGSIATHLDPDCAQTMPHLLKLWSHAHGRWSCYRRVMANKCNKNNDKRNTLLSSKASKISLIKIGKKNDMTTINALQVKLQRQEKKQ